MKRWVPWAAGGGVLLLGVGLVRWARRPRPPYLVMGDSLAVGVGAALERRLPGQVTTAADVGEGLEGTANRLERRLGATPEARTVVISTGTNSLGSPTEELLRRLVGIVQRVRAAGKHVIILGPPPAGRHDAPGGWHEALERWAAVVTTFRDHIDVWALLGDESDPHVFAPGLGAPDGLHPTRAGYARIARAVHGGAS